MSIKPLLPLLLCLFLLSASSVIADRDPRLEQCRQKCFQRQQYSEEERRQCEERCERQYGQGKSPERDQGSQELDQCKQQCKRQQQQERQQCEQGCEEMYGKGREQERERSQELQQCKHGCMQEEPQVRQLCEQQCEAAFGGERRGRDYKENKEEGGRDNPYFFGKDRFKSKQRSEGGQQEFLEKFNKGSELLRGLENYRMAFLETQPNTFAIPAHADFEAIAFVASGRGKITFLYEDSQESHDIQKGDIIRSPAGIIAYLINKEQQHLQIVTIGRVISISGRPRNFYAAGGENPESFLRSFSSEILQAAFNTPRERIEKVFGQQKRGAIIRASPEQIGALSRGKSEGDRNRPYNLFKKKRPTYSNNRGQLSEAYPSDFSQLEDLDVAVSFANISKGAMIAPSYNSRATKIAIVVGGKGYFEMACPHLSRQQDQGKTGQSYRKISSQLSPGDVFVVPAGHPFVTVASRDENLEILCFEVNAQGNERFFLAGKNNVLKNIEKEAKELSFAVPAKEVDEMFDAQRETVFLPGPGQRQQEREGREGGHGDLASTLSSIFF